MSADTDEYSAFYARVFAACVGTQIKRTIRAPDMAARLARLPHIGAPAALPSGCVLVAPQYSLEADKIEPIKSVMNSKAHVDAFEFTPDLGNYFRCRCARTRCDRKRVIRSGIIWPQCDDQRAGDGRQAFAAKRRGNQGYREGRCSDSGVLSEEASSGRPVKGSRCLSLARRLTSSFDGFSGGFAAARSFSHWNVPSQAGSGAGGSGTICSISGTIGLRSSFLLIKLRINS